MKKLLLAATAIGALSLPAHAGTLTYDSYSFTGIGSITITSPNGITGGAGPITLYDKGKVVVADAWCLDVHAFLAQGSQITVGTAVFNAANADVSPGVPSNLSASQVGVISWLVDIGDHTTDATLQGAIQVAIWSTEYSNFAYNSLRRNLHRRCRERHHHGDGRLHQPRRRRARHLHAAGPGSWRGESDAGVRQRDPRALDMGDDVARVSACSASSAGRSAARVSRSDVLRRQLGSSLCDHGVGSVRHGRDGFDLWLEVRGMVDGKTQLFADMMIAWLDLVLVGAVLVAVVLMGALAAHRWALQAARGDFDEPSD